MALCVRACVLAFLSLHNSAYVQCSGLARPSTPALPYLDVLLGAAELPRRLAVSCVCAGLVPVAPAVGSVLAYLAQWCHTVWCDVCGVSSVAACIVP